MKQQARMRIILMIGAASVAVASLTFPRNAFTYSQQLTAPFLRRPQRQLRQDSGKVMEGTVPRMLNLS